MSIEHVESVWGFLLNVVLIMLSSFACVKVVAVHLKDDGAEHELL